MKYIILFLFFPFISFSQKKMQYELLIDYSFEWQTDSINIHSKIKTENFKLYLSKDQSLFVSQNRIGLDTLIYNNANMSDLNNLMNLPQPSSNKRILKTSNKTIVYDAFMSKTFKFEDNEEMSWVLLNEQDSLFNIKVKKAKTTYKGREYIAWYSEDIPVADGPYKFKGLPGLIVKIFDTKNQINFSLVSLKRFNKSKEILINYDSDSESTTFEEYYKTYNSFMENPIPFMESEGMVFNEETKKIIRDRFKEKRKRANNIIELTD